MQDALGTIITWTLLILWVRGGRLWRKIGRKRLSNTVLVGFPLSFFSLISAGFDAMEGSPPPMWWIWTLVVVFNVSFLIGLTGNIRGIRHWRIGEELEPALSRSGAPGHTSPADADSTGAAS